MVEASIDEHALIFYFAVFPARLVAYHAGTGRTTFLACMKVTTIFTLAFYGLVVTPATFKAGEPWWKVIGGEFMTYARGLNYPSLTTTSVASCGIIPFCFVAYVTAPFVTFVRIILPDFARQSKEILHRFAKNPPTNTSLEVTTISLIGKPRVSSMMIADLKPTKQRFGLVNYMRDTKAVNAQRNWYMYSAVGKFHIPSQPGKDAKDAGIWDDLAAIIARRAAQESKPTRTTQRRTVPGLGQRRE
jgi:hypothetical protein